jgi:hypothetical protein
MTHTFEQLIEASRIIRNAEYSLARRLSAGERRDLIKDNTPWPSDVCDSAANAVTDNRS